MVTTEKDPDSFEVGEMIDADGELGMMLGFEVDGEMTRYRLHPRTAIDLVHAISDWLDRHHPGSP